MISVDFAYTRKGRCAFFATLKMASPRSSSTPRSAAVKRARALDPELSCMTEPSSSVMERSSPMDVAYVVPAHPNGSSRAMTRARITVIGTAQAASAHRVQRVVLTGRARQVDGCGR
jgi:hypothetical protein